MHQFFLPSLFSSTTQDPPCAQVQIRVAETTTLKKSASPKLKCFWMKCKTFELDSIKNKTTRALRGPKKSSSHLQANVRIGHSHFGHTSTHVRLRAALDRAWGTRQCNRSFTSVKTSGLVGRTASDGPTPGPLLEKRGQHLGPREKKCLCLQNEWGENDIPISS